MHYFVVILAKIPKAIKNYYRHVADESCLRETSELTAGVTFKWGPSDALDQSLSHHCVAPPLTLKEVKMKARISQWQVTTSRHHMPHSRLIQQAYLMHGKTLLRRVSKDALQHEVKMIPFPLDCGWPFRIGGTWSEWDLRWCPFSALPSANRFVCSLFPPAFPLPLPFQFPSLPPHVCPSHSCYSFSFRAFSLSPLHSPILANCADFSLPCVAWGPRGGGGRGAPAGGGGERRWNFSITASSQRHPPKRCPCWSGGMLGGMKN